MCIMDNEGPNLTGQGDPESEDPLLNLDERQHYYSVIDSFR